ncbi:MAG: WD40/YVTN/BNR-like repeat-containing protein [Chitinophagales bacterium]
MGFQNSNWVCAGTNTTGTITDIQFSTIDTGFIFGYSDSRPFISGTTDGGYHWHLVKAFDDSYPGLISFYPISSAHLLLIRDTLYSSMDGGITWNKAPAGDQVFTSSVFQFYFTGPTTGYAISEGLYRTADGNHWSLVQPLTPGYDFIQFTDSLHGFIAGGNVPIPIIQADVPGYGLLATTTDGGHTWQERIRAPWIDNTQNFDAIVGMRFLDNQKGFIATHNKKLYFTSDGAATFHIVNSNTPAPMNELYFETAQIGYYLAGNQIYRTADGGQSFALDFTASDNLLKIFKGKNAKIFAIGYNGMVLLRN